MTKESNSEKGQSGTKVSREQVLNAALELVLEDGVQAVSLRKIASRIGCAAPTIYYYFHSKQEILETLWSKQIDVVLDHCFKYTELFDILYHYGHYWLINKSLFQLMFLGEDVKVSELKSYAVLEKTIEAKFHERGNRFEWAERRTLMTLSAIHGLVLSGLHREFSAEESDLMLNTVISLLLSDQQNS